MGKRTDFGSNWTEVVANWFLGKSPPITDHTGWEALGTLERLWPEYINEVVSKGYKGPTVMSAVIDRGVTLAACENLIGFHEVLERMKQGERPALSEAFFAAELVKIGYVPEFGPWLDRK